MTVRQLISQGNEEAVVWFEVEKIKIAQQASLRKKMKENFSSKVHQICTMQLKENARMQFWNSQAK